jgi:AraC-like DNA-binding protein
MLFPRELSPVNIVARAGMHAGDELYALAKRTPSAQSLSSVGVASFGWTQPRWSDRCWSVQKINTLGRGIARGSFRRDVPVTIRGGAECAMDARWVIVDNCDIGRSVRIARTGFTIRVRAASMGATQRLEKRAHVNPRGRGWFRIDADLGSLLRLITVEFARSGRGGDRPPRWSHDPNVTTVDRLLWVRRGTGAVSVDGVEVDVAPGTVAVCPAGAALGGHVDAKRAFSNGMVMFNARLRGGIDLLRTFPCPVAFAGDTGKRIAAAGERVVDLDERGDAVSLVRIHGLIAEMLTSIYAAPASECPPPTGASMALHGTRSIRSMRSTRDIVREAISVMVKAARAGRSLGVEQLAAKVGRDRAYFTRLFRTHTGTTPRRFLEQLRMEAACERLRSEDLTVSEIAARVGYADPHHFSRAFARVMGAPPTAYRAACRPAEE